MNNGWTGRGKAALTKKRPGRKRKGGVMEVRDDTEEAQELAILRKGTKPCERAWLSYWLSIYN